MDNVKPCFQELRVHEILKRGRTIPFGQNTTVHRTRTLRTETGQKPAQDNLDAITIVW